MTPERFRTADFDYQLPPELIAQEPLPKRGTSRLLIVFKSDRRTGPADRRSVARHSAGRRRDQSATVGSSVLVNSRFARLPSLIPAGDLLILNTTRVRHARLLGARASGRPAEILLIRQEINDTWVALGKPGSALRPGKLITLGPEAWVETIGVLTDGTRLVRFIGLSAEDAIGKFGHLPLPPYIARAPTPEDETRYQTVYADAEGSVAAPTAGLHFTAELLKDLTAAGVLIERLDLEIGPGTFRPVEVEDPRQHEMHPERYDIAPRLAARVREVREAGGSVWAVGTTVVRALESAADPGGLIRSGRGETNLMITPGYTFRVVDRLVTNFHLPRSTLLMLVSAFAGPELIMAAYQHAIVERYRFYSYGDAMVII